MGLRYSLDVGPDTEPITDPNMNSDETAGGGTWEDCRYRQSRTPLSNLLVAGRPPPPAGGGVLALLMIFAGENIFRPGSGACMLLLLKPAT